MELTLQARNLRRKEARAAGEAWAGIKAIWALRPRLWRTQSGHQEVAESCPELQREFSEPPLTGFGERQGMKSCAFSGLIPLRASEMWDHDGLCACGKRTYSPDALPASSRRRSTLLSRSPKGRTSRFAGLRTATQSLLSWASKLTGS